ncbi:hypothetical protein K7I13_06545 [Brucepastera parasyntrophica]|uniref:hypothetical protein n=1 Tax=Brucepastera parasyntrophica TaxID=2880008 RepID=UPI00210BBC2E|nr:hypothetical protein [Brucepastera parasyntrophica]ULQ60913.1 hypothetical protein K7I13_06545 [Brucepastera parasyntrophica]
MKNSGEYVVYRDYTWADPTWVGFLFYDNSTYGAFCVTPSTGSRVAILFRTETLDGQMILTGQNIISEITQDDVLAVNYLMQLLPDMYRWRSSAEQGAGAGIAKIKNRPALFPPAVQQKISAREFGGDVVLTYTPETPFFNLHTMTGADGGVLLQLVRTGQIDFGGDSVFFEFVPVPEDITPDRNGSSYMVPKKRKAETKTVDGIKLKLDDQWTMVADNAFFLGNEAVILVDILDYEETETGPEDMPILLLRLFSFSGRDTWSIPSEMTVTGSAKRFRIDNTFYDSENDTLRRSIKVCIPQKEGYAVISLAVTESVYRANRKYFDGLF